MTLGGKPPLLADDVVTIAGCAFNVSGAPSPCLRVQWQMPATRVTVESSAGAALELGRAVRERRERAAGDRARQRLPDAGAGAVRSARHPYRLTPARRLAEADLERHIADLVRLVLLTGPRRAAAPARLRRRPGRPRPCSSRSTEALRSVVEVRARGSLDSALGDRIEVVEVAVERVGRVDARRRTSPTGCAGRRAADGWRCALA